MNILCRPMFEMGTTTWEPPQLIHLMHPVLSSFDFSKTCMIHIASPDIIPTGWPSYWYLIILWRWNQAKQALLKWWAMPLQFFFSRNIQISEQILYIRNIMAGDVLVECQWANIHPSFRDQKCCFSVSKSNFVCKHRNTCKCKIQQYQLQEFKDTKLSITPDCKALQSV